MILDPQTILDFLIKTAHAAGNAAPQAAEAVQRAAEVAQEATTTAGHAAEAGVLDTLGINWKLFIGQLINFGIILFVLWKWVFPPVAKKLTERSETIEKSLHDADQIAKEKKEFESWRKEEVDKTRISASEIVSAAQNEAIAAKQKITEETKAEQEKLVGQAKRQIEEEKEKAISESKAELANLITAATEKIIKKKLDPKADEKLIKDSLESVQ